MGCESSVEITRSRKKSSYNHNENDLVEIGEYNGQRFSGYYFDNKHARIIYRNENKHCWLERILDLDGTKMILLVNDNYEYIFVDYDRLLKHMEKKYHEEMRNKIRDEVRLEFSNNDLLLP